MSDSGGHGPRLVAYLEELAGNQSMRSFAPARGLDHAAISRWKNGADPSIDGMRQVAKAIDKTFGQVMVIAGYGTPEDFGGAEPGRPTPPSAIEAIEYDPTLSPGEREALLAVLNMARRAAADGRSGRGGKRTIRTR